MLSSVLGRFIVVRLVQPLNALLPILVKPSENSMVFSPVQSLKAKSPITVTLAGIVTPVSVVQFWNAEIPISVTPSGITTSPPSPKYAVRTPSSIWKSSVAPMLFILAVAGR